VPRITALLADTAARFGKRWWFADDSAASILEYAIVMAMISVAAVTALSLMGTNASTVLTSAAGSLGS
jgi:Flp pilus assembly pilin Flp